MQAIGLFKRSTLCRYLRAAIGAQGLRHQWHQAKIVRQGLAPRGDTFQPGNLPFRHGSTIVVSARIVQKDSTPRDSPPPIRIACQIAPLPFKQRIPAPYRKQGVGVNHCRKRLTVKALFPPTLFELRILCAGRRHQAVERRFGGWVFRLQTPAGRLLA